MSIAATEESTRTIAVLRLPNRFDVHEVAVLNDAVRSCGGRLVVDLGEARFIDLRGIEALLAARSEVEGAGGEFRLVRLSDTALITFELMGVAETLGLRARSAPELVAA